jgi:predicted transcriptional regulator
MYASSPTKAFVGFAEVDRIISDTPKKLWKVAGKQGGISYENFMAYFRGKTNGYAIKLKGIHKFTLSPYEIFDDFRPPQSFKYINDLVLNKIYEMIDGNGEHNIHRRRSRGR